MIWLRKKQWKVESESSKTANAAPSFNRDINVRRKNENQSAMRGTAVPNGR
jgi:hypothetical protein